MDLFLYDIDLHHERVKVNGVEFKSNPLVLDEAKTEHKDRT